MVKSCLPDHPLTLTMMSCWKPVLDGATATLNMSIRPKSPSRLANTPNLVGHISKLEMMHEVLEGNIDAIFQTTVLFSHTDKLKISEFADADTDLIENRQYNGATLMFITHPSLPHSPL